jgi:hypothetical protein
LETLYSTGIRRMELINLTLADVDAQRGVLTVRQGKGKRDRVVPIGQRALRWLTKYQEELRPHLLVDPGERAIFLTRLGQPFSASSLSALVTEMIRKSGVAAEGSCHLSRIRGLKAQPFDVAALNEQRPDALADFRRAGRIRHIGALRSGNTCCDGSIACCRDVGPWRLRRGGDRKRSGRWPGLRSPKQSPSDRYAWIGSLILPAPLSGDSMPFDPHPMPRGIGWKL